MSNLSLLLNSLGLSLGVLGALGLALLPKNFIRITPEGNEFWGPEEGMSPDDTRRRNLRIRKLQRIGIPLSYGALILGFLLQLCGLWLA